jgi:hypothetical protein
MLDRRQFLLGGLTLGGAAAFGGLGMRALAGTETDVHFVFCYFSGAWDVLLSLDPRDPTRFHAGNVQDTLIYPGYELLRSTTRGLVESSVPGMVFGPHFGRLGEHADKLAIVRGMSMDTLTHEAGMRRFLTGKPPSGLQARGSSVATWLAASAGSGLPIPNLAASVESYNVDLPPSASALGVSSVSDLLRAVRPGADDLPEIEREQLDALFAHFDDCPANRRSAFRERAEGSRLAARELVARKLDRLFDFSANTPEMEAIRSHYGIRSGDLTSAAAQAAMAATAITSGVSRCVSIRVASGLDTHYDDWATDQGPAQEAGFDLVAALIEDLGTREYGDTGESWLDHTVIVGFSEFARTALVNARGGRDHSLTNACLLAGGGIKGGQVIGRSSDVGLMPTPTDLATGRADESGEIVRPEHVLRALMVRAGISTDVADLRVEPLRALFG